MVELYREAYSSVGSATVGNIAVGDVNINAAGITQADASNSFSVYQYADAGASGAATVGTITVGNISAKTGLSGHVFVEISQEEYGGTDGSTGRVTVGNISLTGSKSASMTAYVYNKASVTGTVGGVTVGNVTMKGDTSAGTASFEAQNWADNGDTGTVSIGNVNLAAQKVYFSVSNSAEFSGKAGAMTVGNVTLKGNDNGGSAGVIHQWGYDAAGTLNVGNVTLTTLKGNGTTAGALDFGINNSSSKGTVGTTTIGDIAITLASGDKANQNSTMSLDITTDGVGSKGAGNIVTGNITIGTSGVTTKATLAAHAIAASVNITSTDGTVTVGNITVTGGVTGANLTDNLDVLTTWLNLSGSTVTVGNVDYSGYAAASTIDVSGYTGVGVLKASKGGSTITDNKSANSIDLTANTTKADAITFQVSQSGVKDSGGAITASQTGLDTITGWAAGDSLTVVGGIKGDGDLIQNTPSQTYAQFLANAEAQITVAGNSAYVAVIGGNTYVALNVGTTPGTNDQVGEIVEVMGAHTFTWSAGTLVFLT
jgi:hypothetical protein